MDAGHLCISHLSVNTIKCMKAMCYNQVLVLSALSVPGYVNSYDIEYHDVCHSN